MPRLPRCNYGSPVTNAADAKTRCQKPIGNPESLYCEEHRAIKMQSLLAMKVPEEVLIKRSLRWQMMTWHRPTFD